MAGSRMDIAFQVFRKTLEFGIMSGWPIQRSDSGCCGRVQSGWYDRRTRCVRDLSCGDARIYLEIEVRRMQCKSCGHVKHERLYFLADNPLYTNTKRFAHYVGRRWRQATGRPAAKRLI